MSAPDVLQTRRSLDAELLRLGWRKVVTEARARPSFWTHADGWQVSEHRFKGRWVYFLWRGLDYHHHFESVLGAANHVARGSKGER